MLCAIRNQSHPREVEDTDSVPASAWASPLERVTQDVSRGIKEDAHTASPRDGKRWPHRSEGSEWQITACRVFSVRVNGFRCVASDQNFDELGQGVSALSCLSCRRAGIGATNSATRIANSIQVTTRDPTRDPNESSVLGRGLQGGQKS